MNIKLSITQSDVDEYNCAYFKDHPRSKKKRIDKPQHPSLNWYSTANNLQVNSVKQNWKEFIQYVLLKNNLTDYKIYKCHIVYTTFFKDRRVHDVDNITPKFILDGFTESEFLIKDDYEHILSLTTIGRYDKSNPRIEFEINVIEYEKREKEN